MFAIIGILIVIAAIMGGYLMEHGIVKVLLQPAELLIILGAAIGTVLIANPLHILKKIAAGIVGVFTGSKFTKDRYVATLKMMYDLFNKARKDGLMGMEADVEDPAKSAVFAKHPQFLKDHHIRDFVCDTLRMAITGAEAFDLDQLLDLDMEVHHLDAGQPIAALSSMADSLPGLGIVAAVLGVVITMGALGGPPEEIGKKVAAALVGTFLGILLCYGLVGPLAVRMGKIAAEQHAYLMVLRVMMIAFLKGVAPIMAIKIGRRTVPGHVRPSFQAVEEACRGAKDDPAAEAAAAVRSMPTPPIIIIKKKSGHGGHHGGAWKVAYADFVTAMMALFIVLWLLSSTSKQTQIAISGYFKDPSGTSNKPGSALAGVAEELSLKKDDMAQLKEKLQSTTQTIADLDKLKKNIEMTVTAEGLRIELIESEKGTFFDSGSPKLNANGQELLGSLAAELEKVPNRISIEGHTDAKPFSGKSSYSNWELSSDRANAARRLMQHPDGLGPDQVSQVRGFADQRLRN